MCNKYTNQCKYGRNTMAYKLKAKFELRTPGATQKKNNILVRNQTVNSKVEQSHNMAQQKVSSHDYNQASYHQLGLKISSLKTTLIDKSQLFLNQITEQELLDTYYHKIKYYRCFIYKILNYFFFVILDRQMNLNKLHS